jgi:hypothetical protein
MVLQAMLKASVMRVSTVKKTVSEASFACPYSSKFL